jgi:hypothetical protein
MSSILSSSNDDYDHDIFISYTYENTNQVANLYDKLTKTYEIKTWLVRVKHTILQ